MAMPCAIFISIHQKFVGQKFVGWPTHIHLREVTPVIREDLRRKLAGGKLKQAGLKDYAC